MVITLYQVNINNIYTYSFVIMNVPLIKIKTIFVITRPSLTNKQWYRLLVLVFRYAPLPLQESSSFLAFFIVCIEFSSSFFNGTSLSNWYGSDIMIRNKKFPVRLLYSNSSFLQIRFLNFQWLMTLMSLEILVLKLDFMSNFLKISLSTKTLSAFKGQPHKMERKNNL